MDKYVVIATENSWGDQSSAIYVLEATTLKSAIFSVICAFPDNRYDTIDVDYAMSNCEYGISKDRCSVYLKNLTEDSSGAVIFEAYKIYDNEPTARWLWLE